MKMAKWSKRIIYSLCALVVAYFVVGSIFVMRVSEREETWHDEAIARSDPATHADWLDAARTDNPRIELRYRPKASVLYLIRIYEDRGYVSALHPGSSDVPPLHIETGSIASDEWRALRDLGERLYLEPDLPMPDDDRLNPANLRLTLVHENQRRILYKYRATDYAQLPPLLREYDALLFETMQSWQVKPHHGHAKPAPQINYGANAIPSLLRGLESPREDLHASVVERLVGIGPAALPELTRVLRDGEQTRYRPVSRYLAVVDGIGKLADQSSEGYTLVKALADSDAGTPGQRALQKKAREVVKQY